MNQVLSFADVLLTPQFSSVRSRANVDTSVILAGTDLKSPLISSNMDSVTNSSMAIAMAKEGGVGCLHRFWSIEDNVKAFKSVIQDSGHPVWVSVGVGDKEYERGTALVDSGANVLILDVAHGASIQVVEQTKRLLEYSTNIQLVVGNFATGKSIQDFLYHLGGPKIGTFKIGIGMGSACTTRMVTGCGLPSFDSLLSCRSANYDIIQDGGISSSGDLAKAIAAGAKAAMIGRLFAGCEESPAEEERQYISEEHARGWTPKRNELGTAYKITHKYYRGSASADSYKTQGKTAFHRTPEGEAFLVPYRGPVKGVIEELSAGLRSAMSYVGAHNIEEFQSKAEFVQVSNNGHRESMAYGKEG